MGRLSVECCAGGGTKGLVGCLQVGKVLAELWMVAAAQEEMMKLGWGMGCWT